MTSDTMRKQLSRLVSLGEPKFTDTFFPYTSGEIGPYFFQSIAITANGRFYAEAIRDLARLVEEHAGDAEIISGGETRDWDFSNPVAVELELPHAKLYKDRPAIGAQMSGKQVVHVADLNNEGSSMRDHWLPQITKAGGIIKQVFFYVDRMESGVQVMKDLGLERHALVQLDADAWQFLLDTDVITPELYNSLNARLEDKQAWAENALRTHIDRVIELHSTTSTRSKIEKVLDVGYPHLKPELINLMRRKGYVYE